MLKFGTLIIVTTFASRAWRVTQSQALSQFTTMKLMGYLAMIRAIYFSVAMISAGQCTAEANVDFRREVLPILSDNCFACHGPDTQKMKGGLRLDQKDSARRSAKSGKIAIIPGKPKESELMRRILSNDSDERMPPGESHKVLSDAQKDILQRWIAEGAEYQGHWAYEVPVKPAAPAGPAAIDFLVKQRLTERELTQSPPADRRTLIRRLSYDLTGLPPRPEEIDRFISDRSADAYSQLVERLLKSPHFGERMAIGWLDVVRFADTIGYHSDTPRDIFPYRDYVIRSFNNNKAFDQFTIEQLAGDLVPSPTLDQRVGSAFNRLLLTTEEGGAQEKDYEARYLTDRVRAVGAVWLGQTIGCAQCHDHKFDPITARDFYTLGAFFADIKEPIVGRRGPGALIPNDSQAPILARHENAVVTLEKDFNGPHPELASLFNTWESEQQSARETNDRWRRLLPYASISEGGATLTVREDRSVLVSGKKPSEDNYVLKFREVPLNTHALRLEVIPDDSLPEKGPGRAGNGNFVVTEIVARIESTNSSPKTLSFRLARASHEQTVSADQNPYGRWSAQSTIDQDVKETSAGWAILPETGRANQLQLELKEPLSLNPGESLVVEVQQKHGHGSHTLGCFRISSIADNGIFRTTLVQQQKELIVLLQVEPEKRTTEQRDKLLAQFRSVTPELAALRKRLAEARTVLADYSTNVARCLITERSDKPRTVRVLPRGNWMIETGEIVEPSFPGYLTRGKSVPDRRLTRLDLAQWLVSRENPLTARVVMNRLWKQFFGIGLSRVIDDLGAQGEIPPNQALLDWLACEFRDHGWDWKRMVRTIVMSETYRQSSTAAKDALVRDPENRDLARQSRWRLDAELVRDNALSIAGILHPEIGGPSVFPYQPDNYWENLNFPIRTYQSSSGTSLYRRGIYVWWQRSYTHPSMLAFDAPTREECAVDRNRSNIPQQALVLLNDPIYVEAARAFAQRILREGGTDSVSRLTWAWRQALGRNPRSEELATIQNLLTKHLQEYQANLEAARAYLKVGEFPIPSDANPSELAAWINIARTLLNLHETMTRS